MIKAGKGFITDLQQHINKAGVGATTSVIGNDVLFVSSLHKAWDLMSHRAVYNVIVVCRNGRITADIGGRQVCVSSGQLLLIPAGKAVLPLEVSSDMEGTALLISDKSMKQLLGSQISIWNKALYVKNIYLVEETDWLHAVQHLSELVLHLHGEMHFREEIQESCLRTVLLLICENLLHHDQMAMEGEEASTEHDKDILNRFFTLLDQQQKKQSVAFYADLLNITPKYLCTICMQATDKSPSQWIRESVLHDCHMLLKETDLPVKIISYRLGFPNTSFFGKYFRQATGMTPVAYRKQNDL